MVPKIEEIPGQGPGSHLNGGAWLAIKEPVKWPSRPLPSAHHPKKGVQPVDQTLPRQFYGSKGVDPFKGCSATSLVASPAVWQLEKKGCP